MNEKDKISGHLQLTDCPSPEVFSRYLAGKLGDDELSAFLAHTGNCDLCREALEGYESFAPHLDFDTEIKELNRKVDDIVKEKSGRSAFFNRSLYFSLAASVILVLASIFLVRNVVDENNSGNGEGRKLADLENDTAATAKLTRPEISSPGQTGKAKENITMYRPGPEDQAAQRSPEAPKEVKLAESTDDDLAVREDVKVPESADKIPIKEEESQTEEKAIAFQEIAAGKTTRKAVPKAAATEAQPGKTKALDPEDSAELSDYYLQNAKIAYDKGNTDQALDFSNKAVEADPTNNQAVFNLGLMNYQMGNYRESVPYFNRVIEEKDANAYESKWLLALSYYHSADVANAKKWLKELSETEGKHRTEAAELLKKLE